MSVRTFKTRPKVVPVVFTNEQKIQSILELVKAEKTDLALEKALKTLTKEEMVDFALEVMSKRFSIYKLGVQTLKAAITANRSGNPLVLDKYHKQLQSRNQFKFSGFDMVCANIATVELCKPHPNSDEVDLIMFSLMTFSNPIEEDLKCKTVHIELISDILSSKFNNNTMKVLYGV